MDRMFELIGHYGYAGVFFALVLGIVGLPVPDETILVGVAGLMAAGTLTHLHLPGVFIAALLGSWCGITVSYWIGRTLGVGVIHRFGKYLHLNDERLEKMNAWFAKTGHWALFIGYYVAGVRHFTAIVAGISKVPFPTFMLYAWSGGLVWVSVFLTLGHFLGKNWEGIFEVIHRYVLVVSIVLILGLVLYFVLKRRRTRTETESGHY
jgi:membrane protein DedA with SNARE-associated domain